MAAAISSLRAPPRSPADHRPARRRTAGPALPRPYGAPSGGRAPCDGATFRGAGPQITRRPGHQVDSRRARLREGAPRAAP
ncbi:hypothetical protein SAVIM40S_01927 [Streptomyces avidinii]